jgi:hypothetical protein
MQGAARLEAAAHAILARGQLLCTSIERARARSASGKAMVPMDDERIEAFVRDVLSLEREERNVVRAQTRFHLAVYEKLFRDSETDDRKKDAAARRCRMLCRLRVVEEMAKRAGTPTAEHLKLVLDVIGGPANVP